MTCMVFGINLHTHNDLMVFYLIGAFIDNKRNRDQNNYV